MVPTTGVVRAFYQSFPTPSIITPVIADHIMSGITAFGSFIWVLNATPFIIPVDIRSVLIQTASSNIALFHAATHMQCGKGNEEYLACSLALLH